MIARTEIAPDGKILVVDLAYIGDLLMSTPAIACLRKAYPQAQIDILVSPGSKGVIERNPDVNTVFVTDMKKRGWDGIREEAGKVRNLGYDLAISFHRAHGSLLMLRMSGVKHRTGFTNSGRGLMLTGGVKFQIQSHRAWNHLRLLEKGLGIEVDYTTPTRLDLDPVAVEFVESRLGEINSGNGLIAVNPNAAWSTKRWTPEGFASVCDRLTAEGFTAILIGSPAERHISEAVRKLSKSEIIDWTGETSLQQLAALFSKCRLVISNDSGPMHMAQATGTEVVPIFGPTDPSRCGPWLGKIEPIQKEMDCIKCYRKRCWHHGCMKEITGKRVNESLLECLSIS